MKLDTDVKPVIFTELFGKKTTFLKDLYKFFEGV